MGTVVAVTQKALQEGAGNWCLVLASITDNISK